MSLKHRVIDSTEHKHNWKEDQWGKRCQSCGRVRTKKGEARWELFDASVIWFYDVLGWSLMISALILLVKYYIEGKNVLTPDGSFAMLWILLCFAFGSCCFWWKAVLFEKEVNTK